MMEKDLTEASVSLFWYWIRERQIVYLRKKAKERPPWTSDLILQRYRFTNPFRQNDKTTVWLNEHFVYPHDKETSLLLFNICWFRLFNLIETGEDVGFVYNYQELEDKIIHRHRQGSKLFTSAFMQRGYAGIPKHISTLETCKILWKDCRRLYDTMKEYMSMEEAFNRLISYPMIGPFYAYEIVCDLRYTNILCDADDVNTWANVGPGAARGLRRLYPNIKKGEMLCKMIDLLKETKEHFIEGREKNELEMPSFELRDIEHSLCEFDKYCRVYYGEGRPKQRYRGVGA